MELSPFLEYTYIIKIKEQNYEKYFTEETYK